MGAWKKELPTQEFLMEVLDYNPDTGVFLWKERPSFPKKWNTRYVGTVAGRVSAAGHRGIQIDEIRYVAHRLAWVYVHGGPPSDQLDHINGNRDDNRVANLREATSQQNNHNSRGKSRCGLPKGVAVNYKGFRAQIRVDGKNRHLGTYPTPEEAAAVYAAEARKHFGEFARTE